MHRRQSTIVGAVVALALFLAAFIPATRYAGAAAVLGEATRASVVMRAVTACALVVGAVVIAAVLAAAGAAVAEAVALLAPAKARRGGATRREEGS